MEKTQYPNGITEDEFSALEHVIGHATSKVDYFDEDGLGASAELCMNVLNKLVAASESEKISKKHRKVY